MKIVQLIYSLCSGGAERFVVSLSNQLAELGHEVHLCMLRTDNEPNNIFNKIFLNQQVHFTSLKVSEGFSFAKVKKVEQYIEGIMPDIVHCHLNVVPYIYRLALRHPGMRIFHTLHSLAPKTYSGRIQYLINKYMYSHNYIRPITISSECTMSYQATFNLNNAKCIINGCEKVHSSDGYNDVKREIAALKSSEKTPVFVHVARFHGLKNQEMLIRCFNRLASEGVDFRLLIIGAGFDSAEGHRLKLLSCPQIVFLGEKSNVGDYLLNSDYFILSSIYEGLPISLIEAMSCGLVCISTPAGGVKDVLINDVNGFLSEDFSEESLYNTILRAMDPVCRIDTTRIQEEYEQTYSIRVCAHNYQSHYAQ